MAEAVAGDVVIAYLDHQFCAKRLPLGRTRCAPATRSPWRIAGEAGRGHKLFQTLGEGRLFSVGEGRGEADMVQKPILVVEPQQQRSHQLSPGLVAETAYYAISSAKAFDL